MLQTLDCSIDKALARDVLAEGYPIHARTLGPSMYPLIRTGYRILVKPAGAVDLSIGDIVLFQRGQSFVVHRLIKKNNATTVLTRGDNMTRCDAPIPMDKVLGKVVRIENGARMLVLTGRPNKLLGYFIALYARLRFRGQVRLTRNLSRIHWLLGGRRIK